MKYNHYKYSNAENYLFKGFFNLIVAHHLKNGANIIDLKKTGYGSEVQLRMEVKGTCL